MFKRKTIIGALAAVMTVLIAAAFLLFSAPRTAFAERGGNWTIIGEIYNDSTKTFDEDNLNKLYKAIAGAEDFDSVQSAANSGKTSDDFRSVSSNNGNNVSVWFGGKKWDAVYLTTAQNGGGDTQKGDVILDLWQSADTVTTRAGFAKWKTEALNTNTDIYPVNLYSASKMRVETLNAGGYYSTDANTSVSNKQGQNSGNQYARFTMSTVNNSLTEYIAKPSEVGYQATEFNSDTAIAISDQSRQGQAGGSTYYLPNDAYGTPSGGQWFDSDFGNLYNKDDSRNDEAKYGAWQNDYLWLPSITEVGCSATATGIWNTDLSLRSAVAVNDDIGKTTVGSFVWLRSAFCSDEDYETYGPSFVYVMGVNDGSNNHADWTSDTTEMNLVRPALHLNLSAANGNVKSAWKSVGEIYQDGSNSFNRDNMQALYTALTGSGSYGDVRTALNGGNKTSEDFRAKNGGQNVQVTFGGIKWDAVYLTKDKNGNVILDLWQSVDNITKKSVWANKNSALNNPDALYPDNMYSASAIRVITLNAGGNWASDNGAITSAGQSPISPYARFTMTTVADSLTNYIVKPSDVSYQETEFDSATANAYCGTNNYLPNDAYGKPTGGQWATDDPKNTGASYDYSGKPDYNAWKDDYLWLPSITEAGCSSNGTGLWKTDAYLRNSGSVAVWTRSGDDNWAANAYVLEPSGNNQHYYVNYEYAVRPAIHLNLTAINNTFKQTVNKPEIQSKTYTGGALNAVEVKTEDKYNVLNNSHTDVGTYDITFTLKDPDNYKWADEDPNKESITLQFEITKAANKWNGGSGGEITIDKWTYGDEAHKPSAPSAFGEAKFKYTHNDDKGGTYYDEPPTAAGTYWVQATVDGTENYDGLEAVYKQFTIDKAQLTKPTGEATLTGIYKGSPYEIIISDFDGDKMQAELSDSSKSSFEGGKFAATEAKETPYTLTISISDTYSANYEWDGDQTDPVFTITINKATLSVSQAQVADKMYDGRTDNPQITFTFAGFKGSDASTVTVSDFVASYAQATVGDAVTVTVESITLTGAAAANYTVDIDGVPALTGKITKAKLKITLSAGSGKIYDGNNTATVTGTIAEGKVGSDDVSVAEIAAIYEDKNAAVGKTITILSLTLGGAKAGNYEAEYDKTLTATISPLSVDVTLSPASQIYTGGVLTPSVTSGQVQVDSDISQSLKEEVKNSAFTFISAKTEVAKYNLGTDITVEIQNTNFTLGKISGVFEITRANVTVTIKTPQNAIFNGAEQPAEITVTLGGEIWAVGSDYTVTYEGKNKKGASPVNADTYTVKITLTAARAADYSLSDDSAEYTISPAVAVVNWYADYGTKNTDITNIGNITYDGEEHEVKLKLSVGDYSVILTPSDNTFKNANSYTFTATDDSGNFKKDSWTLQITIDKAKLSVSQAQVADKTYDGRTDNPEIEFTLIGFKGSDESTVTVSGFVSSYAQADVGNAVTVTVDSITLTGPAADNYYVDIDNLPALTGKITQKLLTVSLYPSNKVYDGNNIAEVSGAIADGIVNTDDVTIAQIIANFEDKNVGEDKEITVTQVTLGGTMADNYTVVIADLPEITGKITKKTVEVVWDGYEGLIYDGNLKTITATATGVIVDGHAEEIILAIAYSAAAGSTLNENDLPQNAGEYTATASTENGNYALSEYIKTYSVAKQQVTAPTIASKVYSRSAQTADVETSVLYSIVNEGGTNAGNYDVTLTLNDSTNYKWTESDDAEIVLTFTITKATYDMSGVTFEDFSIIYDGEEHSIFISGELPFEEVTVRYENNGQTAVSKYVIKAIFTGDADNYELIPEKTATLTILAVSHDLSGIKFEDVKVKYDGEAHEILIEGELPTNVTVAYEGNGQVEPNIYTITAIFSDPDGVFDTKEATLTILRTQTQTAPKEESSSGGSSSSGESGGGESGSGGEGGSSGESDIDVPEVFIDSEEGFDPTLELVVEKVEDTSRSYIAWGADEVSEKYAVKLCKDGVEVPIEGKVTVRLLIPEVFRDKDFDLMALAKSGAASDNPHAAKAAAAPMGVEGATSVEFTRDGNYVVFETDGLSEYVFTSNYTPYFPVLIAATSVLVVDVLAMIVLAVVINKKRKTKVK